MSDKQPTQIRPLPYVVVYREGYAHQGDYRHSEFETLEEAYEFAGHLRDYRMFVALDIVRDQNRIRDYQRDFAYVGKKIRKEQTDHEE